MKTQIWSRLLLEHVPIWFEDMLVSIGAIVVKDSDSLMWHHRNDRTNLGITTDKILFYTNGNPLQYRTFYGENE
jgi:hypothetical protein